MEFDYLGEARLGDVCDESDLLQPNRESVGRLLALLGERAPPGVTGETPEQIAVLMHALRLDPAATGRLDYRQSSRPQPAGKRGEREVSVTTILEQLRKTAPGLLAAIPPPKATALIERIFMHLSEHLAQAEERMITYEGFGEFRVRKIEREPDGERVTRVTLRLIDPARHQPLATPKAQAEVTVTAAASRRTGAG